MTQDPELNRQQPDPTPKQSGGQDGRGEALRSMAVPLLAVLTALLIAGIIIVVTDPNVIEAFTHLERFVVGADRQIGLSEASDIFSRARLQPGDVISLGDERVVVVETVTEDVGQLDFDGVQAVSLDSVAGREVKVGDTIALPGLWEVSVVEEVNNYRVEISVEEARNYFPDAAAGALLLPVTEPRRRPVVEEVSDDDPRLSLDEARQHSHHPRSQ